VAVRSSRIRRAHRQIWMRSAEFRLRGQVSPEVYGKPQILLPRDTGDDWLDDDF